ncbi:MAG: hypothetical protein KF893_01655 [Caldilineaceae bacterium]|nr:hypothetical protein [Caldilineaceae bacterium]
MSDGGIIYAAPGIVVHCPALPQQLAMKLSAWRDDIDVQDAERLLLDLIDQAGLDQDRLWNSVEPFLVRGQELKARYAFLDLWESIYGDD